MKKPMATSENMLTTEEAVLQGYGIDGGATKTLGINLECFRSMLSMKDKDRYSSPLAHFVLWGRSSTLKRTWWCFVVWTTEG